MRETSFGIGFRCWAVGIAVGDLEFLSKLKGRLRAWGLM